MVQLRSGTNRVKRHVSSQKWWQAAILSARRKIGGMAGDIPGHEEEEEAAMREAMAEAEEDERPDDGGVEIPS